MSVNIDDIPHGLRIATSSLMALPSIITTITWLLIESFTIIILDMDSARHVEYSDVALCGAYVDINNYRMDGLATISNSMSLLRNLNYKQTLQIMPIWNGFHGIILIMIFGYMDINTCMVYLHHMIYKLN